jgi:hypothetical protein
VSGGPGVDLGRPRDVGALLRDALRILLAHPLTFLALSAAFVVPVHLIVSGVGLEYLTAPYREGARGVEVAITTIVTFILIAPLVTAGTIHALNAIAAGGAPNAGTSIVTALEAFTPLLLAVLLSAAGILLGLPLILPGIYLAVRWVFVPQAVMIDGARGADALKRSWHLVEGAWWRTLGVVLLANLAAALPGLLVIIPLEALAEAADREAVSLVGTIVTDVITAPFVALVVTLLFHDLRARQRAGVG